MQKSEKISLLLHLLSDNNLGIESLPLKPVIYFIGIKGTGMCSLAQVLKHIGCEVSGSDVKETFFTDQLLQQSKIAYYEGFSVEQVPLVCNVIIYSSAYDSSNIELEHAQDREKERKVTLLSFPLALARFSHLFPEAVAVAGTHGKTSSTLLAGILLQALSLPATIIAGAGTPQLAGNAFLSLGEELLIVETCEYRNHFMHFSPSIILLTSLEWDHQDFFSTYREMEDSFFRFITQKSVKSVVYCVDDLGVSNLVQKLKITKERKNLPRLIPYGSIENIGNALDNQKGSESPGFAVDSIRENPGLTQLFLSQFPQYPLELEVPGAHLALNGLGVLAALLESILVKKSFGNFSSILRQHYAAISEAFRNFRGASRRSEVLGMIQWQSSNILLMDDYAHHPTAIRKTLEGLKRFYPNRRLVVDFMSHTFSRTQSLHQEFVGCFLLADILILHDIYSSAREEPIPDYGEKVFFEAIRIKRLSASKEETFYYPSPLDSLAFLESKLQGGDLFITMGAGSNRELSLTFLKKHNSRII